MREIAYANTRTHATATCEANYPACEGKYKLSSYNRRSIRKSKEHIKNQTLQGKKSKYYNMMVKTYIILKITIKQMFKKQKNVSRETFFFVRQFTFRNVFFRIHTNPVSFRCFK